MNRQAYRDSTSADGQHAALSLCAKELILKLLRRASRTAVSLAVMCDAKHMTGKRHRRQRQWSPTNDGIKSSSGRNDALTFCVEKCYADLNECVFFLNCFYQCESKSLFSIKKR